MNVQATERPNAHDNNLFDIKGLSSSLDYAFHLCFVFGNKVSLACEAKLTSHFQFPIKVLKFVSQVSFSTLFRYAQFPMSDYLVYL